jgi:hypothetical protein
MTRYVDNPIYCEAVKDFRDAIADFQFDEASLAVVFQYCRIEKYSHESKMCVLELVAERLEKILSLWILRFSLMSKSHLPNQKILCPLPIF